MTVLLTARAFGLAAVFATSLAGLAVAEDVKIPDGPLPPPPEKAAPDTPKSCVTHDPGFVTHKGVHRFRVVLTNTCATRQRCTVNVHLVTSRGPQQGRATLTLPRAARGKSMQADYAIRIPENGGSAQVSHRCRAI
jgi:hypothetical protein